MLRVGAQRGPSLALPTLVAMVLALLVSHVPSTGAQAQCGGFNGGGFNFGSGGFNFGGGGFQGGFAAGFNFGSGGLNFGGGFNSFGNFGGRPGCNTGLFGLIPDAGTVGVGQPYDYRLVWAVPGVWTDLEYLDLQFRNGSRAVIVRWLQGSDTFVLIDGLTGQVLGSGQPRESRTLSSPLLDVRLKETFSENSGLTGQAAGIQVEIVLKGEAEAQNISVDVAAKLDAGTPEAYEKAAVLSIAGQTDANNQDEGRKPTAEQRQQRERTNRANLEDYRTEGNAVTSDCSAPIPTVTIASRDGGVVLQLFHDARLACETVRPGDYVEAVGEKQHEQLYEVDQLTVRRNGTRVR